MPPDGPTSHDALGDKLIKFFWRKPANTVAERTRRRVSLHLIPYLFFLYILAYLDRVNISVAQFGMQKAPSEGGVGFPLDVIGFGAGLFFWGYWILEVPSTISVVRWGARWVFIRILVLWGLCAALMGTIGTPFATSLFSWLPHLPEQGNFIDAVDGWIPFPLLARSAEFINNLGDNPKYQFYFFRFMLGFFEGGFFPSVIVYLSLWFRTEDRAKAIASFMAAIPISSMLGVPLSGLLLDVNWLGLHGWRWIFILEGVAPVIAGIATFFFLPDRPHKAKWLPPDERTWLESELEREHRGKQGHGHWAWVHHLGMVLLLTVVYFFLNLTSYGLSMFMPAIIKSQSKLSSEAASYVAALPYLVAFVVMLLNGRHSDRSGERIWHVAVPLAMLSVGIFAAALSDGIPVVPVIIMIIGVGAFMYAHLPAFWPIPTMFLGSTAAASAIGFINMIGNLGGSVGPTIVGEVSKGQDSFAPALLRLAPWPFGAALVILVVGYVRRKSVARPRTS
jgi:ACS family tartrate transporter-like MFS transporter